MWETQVPAGRTLVWGTQVVRDGSTQLHSLQAGTTACNCSKLMFPLPPPLLLPTRSSHHCGGHWGGGQGAGTQVLVTCSPCPHQLGEKAGEGRLHPVPCLNTGSGRRGKRVPESLSPLQGESGGVLDILFKIK